jgi:hypothetical protein
LFQSLVQAAPQHSFDAALVEGDSTDNTWDLLNEAFPGQVVKRAHGGPIFGSGSPCIEQRERQKSYADSGILDQITSLHEALIYVESDLVWEPGTMIRLLDRLQEVDAVVPLCLCDNREHMFYDTWAYSSGGIGFRDPPPFHPMFKTPSPNGMYPMDYAGSCFVVRGDVARVCKFEPPEREVLSFCDSMRSHGYKLWVDPKVNVRHP